MKKILYDYIEVIKKLPLKDKYAKEDLLKEEFLIDKKGNLEIYYAPHNEYINPKAKVFIIGITPGFQQMNTAIVTSRREIETNKSIEEIQYDCKVAARFSGSLRKNIIEMLDGIELNNALFLDSCEELFGSKDKLMHTVSLIPYPTFNKKENYTGHTPKLIKSEFLMDYVYEAFINEINNLHNKKEILLIPLGKAVEEVLLKLEREEIIENNQILRGFPHPSGANGGRVAQFENNKQAMMDFIKYKVKF